MLAISRFDAANPEVYHGKAYSWGKNHRGQLGLGNKDNQFDPKSIDTAKERFKKVACGVNYSMGLSQTGRVYFWGNFKYFLDLKRRKDVEEPMIISKLESTEVIDIGASFKYCVALVENGFMNVWGQYLKAKYDGFTREQMIEMKIKKDNIRNNRKKGE